jgi:hypothetical protein
MQFARLEPALRLAARGVAEGDAKAIPLLIKLVDRLDRYCDPDVLEGSPLLADLVPRRRRHRPRRSAPLEADEEAVEPEAEPSAASISRESAPTP